jgi:hypothetical protein
LPAKHEYPISNKEYPYIIRGSIMIFKKDNSKNREVNDGMKK